MNNKTVTIVIVSLVVLCACCFIASLSGYLIYTNYRGVPGLSPSITPTPLPISFDGCIITGCSNTRCLDESEAGKFFDNCMWQDSFACYGEAICERQPSGKCGWTETTAFRECLRDVEQGNR